MAHAVSGAAWGSSGGARERDVHPHTKTSRKRSKFSLDIFWAHPSLLFQSSGISRVGGQAISPSISLCKLGAFALRLAVRTASFVCFFLLGSPGY